jgi:hypothetical protein
MRSLWPPAEAAQADYEHLREAIIEGRPLIGPVAARFEAQGLWGLIRRPVAEPVFVARLHGALRPAWTPYGDPRLDLFADALELVLNSGNRTSQETGT